MPFWSHVPQRETTNVHDWEQVGVFQGQHHRGFGAFTILDLKRDLAWPFSGLRLLLSACYSFLNPALAGRVHGGSRGLHVCRHL
jgi:hypothetical protein